MSDKGTNSADSHCTGVVKWFNNRAGYGFVTAADGEKEGTDIFVHHSSIVVEKEQYKYLVQGEYVEFLIIPTEEGVEHEVQASDIRGMRGGKLMCETRFDNRRPRRPRRQNNEGEDEGDEEENADEPQKGTRRGGGGPREGQDMGSTNRRPRNNRNRNRNRNKEQEASS
tara:strand:- start:8 stop:514 length:507 start_codon:yes stop_codon:yes gene_type:complete